jgi:DNA polymerase (family 10)
MDKADVAAVLEEIADILEIQGDNKFRSLAYSKAARAIAQLETSLDEVVAKGELDSIPGIGSTLRDKITTLVTTGHLPFYEDLKAKTPPGLLVMMRVPGVGPKKVKALYDALGIDDLDKLKAACEADQVAGLKGFGKKTQDKILEGLAFLGQGQDRVRLDQALPIAEQIRDALRRVAGVQRIEVCGSVRRRKETIKDIDILVSSDNPGPIMKAFVSLPHVHTVIGQGETKSSVKVWGYADGHKRYYIQCDLRVVNETQYPFALMYFTGSKEHNIHLRQRAIQRGLRLNEYELAGDKKSVRAENEEDIYKALGLTYIPPELREDTGEIAAAEKEALPELLAPGDIKGVFHCHTDWSDGAATLEQMALAAKNHGYQYLGIADHSQSLAIANGLNPERVHRQFKEIDALNARLKGIHLFKGTECDILPDGTLDYDDALLAEFDYVVASVHTHFGQTQEEMTRRIVRALRHPRVTMLGHATGRLLLRRDAYRVDLDAVLKAAAEHGKMIEINANPHRLDLDWIHCKRAKALGVPLVINPDAHATDEFDYMRYGVDVARRGWLTRGDVFNTKTYAQVKKAFQSG